MITCNLVIWNKLVNNKNFYKMSSLFYYCIYQDYQDTWLNRVDLFCSDGTLNKRSGWTTSTRFNYFIRSHLLCRKPCMYILCTVCTGKENWIQGGGNRVSVHFAVRFLDCWRTSFCVTTIIKIVNNNTNNKQPSGASRLR